MWEPLNNILKFDKNTSLNLPDQGKGLLNRPKFCLFSLSLPTDTHLTFLYIVVSGSNL
jgi:hypothetical protein